MNPAKTFVILVAVLLFGGAIWQGVRKWRVSRTNDASPVQQSGARVVGVRTNIIADPPDMNPKVTSNPVVSRFVTFELETGGTLELPVTSEQQAEFKTGDRGQLKYQGTRFLGFAPAQ
jgi:hypothetical protein